MVTTIQADTEVSPIFRPLHEQITGAMERFQVPGVAVGLIVDGQEHVAGFGVTNVNHPSPVTADTMFQIGSTTKTITATIAMCLVEANKLDLHTPIRTYLPDLRLEDESVAAKATMFHLFTHSGGWSGDYFADMGRGDDALTKIVATLDKLPQLTPLGEVWSYNNAGFYLAGRVIEAITGKTYEAVVKEMVLDPLGMDHSFFFPEDVMVHSFAVGHNIVDGQAKIVTPWSLARTANPAGGLTSTPRDQLKYARFHMGDGTAADGARLLSAESVRLMQKPAVSAWEGSEMGLTWFVRDVEGVRVVQHGGTTPGQCSAFLFAPDRGFALTVLTNANRGGELHAQITKWALKHYLGIADPEKKHIARTPEQLQPYVGRYEASMTVANLVDRDGSLILEIAYGDDYPSSEPPPTPPPSRLAFYKDDCIVALDEPVQDTTGEFLRNPDGSIAWLRLGGRIHKRQS